MIFIALRLRQCSGQPAFEAQRRDLRRKLDHQYGIGEAAQDFRPINAARNEQKGQSGGQPKKKAEYIGPPPLGERSYILILPRCRAVRLVFRQTVSPSLCIGC
jgi:hypothetical protein